MSTVATGTDRTSDHDGRLNEHAEDLTRPVPSPEQVKVDEIADSLNRLADLVRSNPELFAHFHGRNYPFGELSGFVTSGSGSEDQRGMLAALARAGTRAGAKVDKTTAGTKGDLFGVRVKLGHSTLVVFADRGEVCERVVVDTREVTEEVPDPQAVAALPTTTVTRVEEIVEWRCGSLMADPPKSAEEWGDSELDHDRVPTSAGYEEYLASRAGGVE